MTWFLFNSSTQVGAASTRVTPLNTGVTGRSTGKGVPQWITYRKIFGSRTVRQELLVSDHDHHSLQGLDRGEAQVSRVDSVGLLQRRGMSAQQASLLFMSQLTACHGTLSPIKAACQCGGREQRTIKFS